MASHRLRLLLPVALLATVAGGVRAPSPERGRPTALSEVRAAGPVTTGPVTTSPAVVTPSTTPETTSTTPEPPPPPSVPVAPLRPAATTTPPLAPPPAPTTAPAAPAPPPSPTPDYAMALVREVIPARWLQVLPVRITVIPGTTSWSSWGGLIEIGDWHLTSSVERAKNVLAHEWGHQVAWHYGTDAYNGAPPAGFPYGGRVPEEMWADCVATALTGMDSPSHGLQGCPGDALAFTRSFLDSGPGPKLR